VIVHRGALSREDWQLVDGLPVTTPVRTIADLAAAGTDAGHLASVVRDALTRGLVTVAEVVAVLAPHAFDYGHRALDGQGFLEVLIAQAGVPATMLAVADLARNTTTTTAPTVAAAEAGQLDVAALMKAMTESPQARDALLRSLSVAIGQSAAGHISSGAGAAAPARRVAEDTGTTGSDRTARPGRSARPAKVSDR
jgi:hypothetical protein